jgi:transcriptional regulator with XRE-family HTH domain
MNWARTLRRRAGLTQAELGRAAGSSQPAIAAYEAGRKSPTLGTLERLARSAGLIVEVRYHPPLTREDRRSLELHRAIASRLREDPAPVLEQARRNVDRMLARATAPSQALREWSVLLDRPLEALLAVLTDPDPWARELRHVTPFAGVLPAAERTRVYRTFGAAERNSA